MKKEKKDKMLFYRLVRCLFKPFVNIFWPTKVVGKENFDSVEGAVVICNHYSVADTLIPAVKLYKKELHVLAKAEAFESKIGGWFLRKVGAIPVHRGEADFNAVKQVLAVLKANKKLQIYPEGTRNKEGTTEMRQFKRGAATFAIKAKKPIVPMLYYRMHKPFRRNWLYIGKPIFLDEFFDSRATEDYDKATEIVYERMIDLRRELDEYVEKLIGAKK